MAAIEERIDAKLTLGRHAELVGELEGLTAEQPLPRGGRQWNARHLAGARLELRGHCIVPTPLVSS
jgi:Bacterial transcriptional activator domain